jgi:hypothetical protein
MKKTFTLLAIAFLITFSYQSYGQLLPKASILKAGFSTAGMSFQKENQFSLHLDIENATKSPYFTSEFGIGFINRSEEIPIMSHPYWGHHNAPEGFMNVGSELYYTKFIGKFYPLSAIMGNGRYQGLYVGLGPGFYYESFERNIDHFGLALFTNAGIQLFLNNRFSAGVEVEMNILGNLETYQSFPEPPGGIDKVRFNNSIKFGYLFNKPSLPKPRYNRE